MPEISEQIAEVVEKAEGEHHHEKKPESKLNTIVAVSVAVAATFMAVSNVKGGNVDQAMQKTQVEIVDTWSFYQAKSTKQGLMEAAMDQLALDRAASKLAPDQIATVDKEIGRYQEKIAKYEKEKTELQQKVEKLGKDYDRLNVKDDQFDMCEALLSVAIALFGITALTRKRWMLFVAGAFAAFGLVVGLSGFAGWNIRPQWLADLLGA